MEIRPLPAKQKITFFEVQYFHNEGKQGTAKNVLLVTYSTNPDRLKAKTDKSVQQRVRFDLATDREIYRKIKHHLGEPQSEEVKREVRRLKKEGTITWFGFRQHHYSKAHRYVKGKRFHRRQLDPNNQVFAFIHSDLSFNVQFNWEGETISVDITQHADPISEGQSVGVGYYTSASTEAELAERLSVFKQPKAAIPELPASAQPTTVESAAHTFAGNQQDVAKKHIVEQSEQTSTSQTSPCNSSVSKSDPPSSTRKKRKHRAPICDTDTSDGLYWNNPFAAQLEPKIDLGTTYNFDKWTSDLENQQPKYI